MVSGPPQRAGVAIVLACLFVISPDVAGAREVDHKVEIVSEPWNSLEVVRLLIGLLTPAAILGISIWMDHRIKEFEHRQWSNQKVIEKRLEVYEKLAPQLNEMMCYFVRVGSWKEHDPTEIVDMKRDLDKIAHVYAPMFSPRFLERYNDFMLLCFATDRGAGLDAQLRAECVNYRDAYTGDETESFRWQPEWDDCFTGPEEASAGSEVGSAYRELLALIARELGVGLEEGEKS